jgi:hypothetical protein
MFGAPAESTAKPQSSIPATEAERTLGSRTADVELDLLELHCRRLRQPGYPAGELEARALAEMLNCALALFQLRQFDCIRVFLLRMLLTSVYAARQAGLPSIRDEAQPKKTLAMTACLHHQKLPH